MGDSAARLRVTLLGGFEVRRGGSVVPVSGARVRGLLVRLALAGGRVVGPSALVDALWPDEQPADPVNALQSLVSRVRRSLGAAGVVVQADGGYRLDVESGDVDALRFERLAADGRERLRASDAPGAAALLGEALTLWGEPEVIASVAPAAATRLSQSAVEAVADLAEAELALRRAADAAERLTALLASQPTHERAAALLMDALAAQGRQAEALDRYEQIKRQLADRLGADPGAALRERHVRLLRTEAVVVGGSEPAPSNLPAPLTSFIGRDDDVARIDSLLAGGRLVTVVGPGGAGKTRLAVEAARRHRHEYPHGAWLVDLASVTEPAKVGGAVLAAIGLRGAAMFEVGAKPRTDELEVLVEQLTGRESLLVVDNCEHLIDAVAHLIALLLPRCAGLRVLATSREPLAVDGEALVPLGPLTLPGPDDGVEQARRTASVRLFVERAAAVRPGFDVVDDTLGDIVRVVRGLDGMPLALELAAARLRTLALPDLAAGLSDRFRLLTTGSRTAPPRQRTLRAVIAWSWELLSAKERSFLERVAVLPGGVTAASAAAITGLPPAEVPDLLAALVDRSLLQLAPEPGRYRMLETLREYGIERLAEQGLLDAVRGVAAQHLRALVAHHDPLLRGHGQLASMRLMRAEYDNALAALRHLCDAGDPDAVRMALDLAWYWQMFGRHADATYWLGEALTVPAGRHRGLERDVAEAVRLLNVIANRTGATSETAAAQQAELRALADRLVAYPALPGLAGAMTALTLFFLDEHDAAVAILQRIIDGSDLWLAGLARLFRCQVSENRGDADQVRIDVEAALTCFGSVGDRWGLATALPMRAILREYDGDLDGALSDLRRARVLAGEFGSLSLSDDIFIDLRWVDLDMRRGEVEKAFAGVAEAREKALRASTPELALLIDALEAGLRARVGDLDRALELVAKAEREMDERFDFGGDHGRALTHSVKAWVRVKQGDGPGAQAALIRAYAAAVESRDMPILAMVTVTAAALADLYGQHREVALLLGAASRLRGAHDRTDPHIAELIGRSRAALGEAAYSAAYTQGWEQDGKTASAQVDPARFRRPALTSGEDQARRL
ncbi:BTAD domain-containing putative transcriptional regulator [Actinoplanes sp. NPDC051470]|uniref:BTAD domain-containing putative transcriptional regulator n=1 Tax=Actinoplanes sp. NPDC051470 TaxID=3157224 RepID=UPI00342CE231